MGWASGFRAGSDIAQRIIDGREKRQLKEGLSRAADQYRVTEGEYGPQLSDNVTQVQGLKQQAIQGGMTPEMAAQQYDPSIAELQRRQGLTAPDFSVGSRGINYGTRQEASVVAQPQVMQAQAQAYESMGQPEKAGSLRADAQRMEATGLEIKGLQRGQKLADSIEVANKTTADFAKGLSTDAEGNPRNLSTEDLLAIMQNRIGAFQSASLFDEANKVTDSYFKMQDNVFKANERTLGADLRKTIASGSLDAFGRFYDKYVLDGAKVTSVTQGKDGAITVSRQTDDGRALPPIKVGSLDEMRATLETFQDSAALRNFSQQSFSNNMETARLAQGAQSMAETARSNLVTEGQGAQRIGLAEDTAALDKWRTMQTAPLQEAILKEELKIKQLQASGKITEADYLNAASRIMAVDPSADPAEVGAAVRAMAAAVTGRAAPEDNISRLIKLMQQNQ